MITKPGRDHLALEAVTDFHRQTYPNRELLVVTDGGVDHLNKLRALFPPSDSVHIFVAPKATLGELRNAALDQCGGEFVIQWDDDDRYEADRISTQVGFIGDDPRVVCSCLTEQLYYFVADRKLYWVDWRNRRPRFNSVKIPGTICVRTSVARECQYQAASKGEDGAFLRDVLAFGSCAEISDMGDIYFRRYHGGNTWDKARFDNNARWLGRTAKWLSFPHIRDALQRVLTKYCTPGTVEVMGKDGPAYSIEIRDDNNAETRS